MRRQVFALATALSIASAVALAAVPATAAPDASPLSLPDRRGVQAYQAGPFPPLRQRIQAAAGFDVPIDVQWEAIALRGKGDQYGEPAFWTNIYFVPLADALAKVGSDALGKQALKERLKQVVVTFDPDKAPASAYENGVTFAGGVLTLDFYPFSNANDVAERTAAIVKRLEAGL